MGSSFSHFLEKVENTSLVVDGILYTGAVDEIDEIDAVTGRAYWTFRNAIDPRGACRRSINVGETVVVSALVKVSEDSGIYANPDMGNFGDEEATESGLRLMYPLAKTVRHVKYNPERFSLEIAVAISKEMGYRGVYSIEGDVPTILSYLMMYL